VDHSDIITVGSWGEVVAVDEVPAVVAGGGGGALPGKVVTQPVDADCARGPALGALPNHSASVQLSIQRSLVTTTHHPLLLLILLAIQSSIKPRPTSIGSIVVCGGGVVQSAGGAGDAIGSVGILLSQQGERDSFLGAIGAAGAGHHSDRLDENLSLGRFADVVLAGVGARAVGVSDASWLALPILTVEAGGVRRVLNIAHV